MSEKCEYCQSDKRRRIKSKNDAYQLKIGKTWSGTKFSKIVLMIGEWNGHVKAHQLQGKFEINYCPMCGRKLGGLE